MGVARWLGDGVGFGGAVPWFCSPQPKEILHGACREGSLTGGQFVILRPARDRRIS